MRQSSQTDTLSLVCVPDVELSNGYEHLIMQFADYSVGLSFFESLRPPSFAPARFAGTRTRKA